MLSCCRECWFFFWFCFFFIYKLVNLIKKIFFNVEWTKYLNEQQNNMWRCSSEIGVKFSWLRGSSALVANYQFWQFLWHHKYNRLINIIHAVGSHIYHIIMLLVKLSNNRFSILPFFYKLISSLFDLVVLKNAYNVHGIIRWWGKL